MAEHVAFGKVRPERGKFGDGFYREMEVDTIPMSLLIHSSQVVIQTDAPEDIDPWTLRNVLLRGAQSQVDIHGFVEGRAYSVELIILILHSGDKFVFEEEIPVLFNKFDSSERDEYINKISVLYSTGNADYLRRSLRDLRLAIRDPHETGFACYRAVESIRKHMHEVHDIPDEDGHRSEGWGKMHEEIGTVEDEITDIRDNFANERRHGGITPITNEQREEVFAVTHDAICKYIDYLYERLD